MSGAIPGVREWSRNERLVHGLFRGLFLVGPLIGVVVALFVAWGVWLGPVELALMVVFYLLSGLGISVGFHRLLTHRAFKTAAPIRGTLAILGCMAAQGPVRQWVADHRRHHKFADRPGDPHSPHVDEGGVLSQWVGLLHAHVGWLFTPPKHSLIAHYAPELVEDRLIEWIDRLYLVWIALSLGLPALIAGWVVGTGQAALAGFLWAGLVRTFLLQHTTFSINSICHYFGRRPFATRDESCNNGWFSWLSFGESWHNNHHAFPFSAYLGLRWWEVDLGRYLIRLLQITGLAWDVKVPSGDKQAHRRGVAAPGA